MFVESRLHRVRTVVEKVGTADGALRFLGDGQVGLDANTAKDMTARCHSVAFFDTVGRLLAYLHLADSALWVENDA